MGPGTGQKLRPLESKDVSCSVSWWLERLTTVWELLFITRDLRLKMSIASSFCLSIEGDGWCETPSRWNLLRCRLLRAKLCITVMSLRRFEMFSYSETNRSFLHISKREWNYVVNFLRCSSQWFLRRINKRLEQRKRVWSHLRIRELESLPGVGGKSLMCNPLGLKSCSRYWVKLDRWWLVFTCFCLIILSWLKYTSQSIIR